MDNAWHSKSPDEILDFLRTSTSGLTSAEAARRLAEVGPNSLPERPPAPPWRIFVAQFANLLIGVLLVATVGSAAVGEWVDAVTILAIVLINGVLGFLQEFKAERAMLALRRLVSDVARVVRDGRQQEVKAAQLVPGDIILLETGMKVPADAYVLETSNLQTQEAVLTGESAPITKKTGALPHTTPLAERLNVLYSATVVTHGTGRGLVIATGPRTEFGRLAQMTQAIEKGKSPLQKRLAVLARNLTFITLGVCAAVVALGAWQGASGVQGRKVQDILMTGVSLAVAVIPEGLPAVVTITLALGLRRMLKRHCLIRRLTANETLGSTAVICTDKTGTLTKNEMTVTEIWLTDGRLVKVSGQGYEPEGGFSADGEPVDSGADGPLRDLLEAAVLCSHAQLVREADTAERIVGSKVLATSIEARRGGWAILGDPTEGALVVAAQKAGLVKSVLLDGVLPQSELSFSSERKRMTVIFARSGEFVAYTKGAPEVLMELCSHLAGQDRQQAILPEMRARILEMNSRMAESGLRVLGVARRKLPELERFDADTVERAMTFLGLVGIVDPPRPEVKGAVGVARRAGIRVVVLTGDNLKTAMAVAREADIKVDRAYEGRELDEMSDLELREILSGPFAIFARVSPEHKLRVMECVQAGDAVTAMTGDGANDAPALKRADVGVGMGIKGTDVAREASDVVLLDDNFASIVSGVEEGRRQYDNIQKFTRYLLSSNFGEIVAIGGAIALGMPLVMLPVQILWMNVVTDGLTALALGLERAEPDVMRRAPRPARAAILTWKISLILCLIGLYEGIATLLVFRYGRMHFSLETARTLAFTGLIIFEKINVFNFRSLRFPLVRVGLFSNKALLAAVAMAIGLQALVVYVPFLQQVFGTRPIDPVAWLALIAIGLPLFLVGELVKLVLSQRA